MMELAYLCDLQDLTPCVPLHVTRLERQQPFWHLHQHNSITGLLQLKNHERIYVGRDPLGGALPLLFEQYSR